MPDSVSIWEHPSEDTIYMMAGWRQWVDGGGTSSDLPQYIIKQTKARKIGEIHADSSYFFQTPMTQDLFRPVVKYKDGYPESLETESNDLYYAVINGKGLVIFLGNEPHLNVEAYSQLFLGAAKNLNVERIILTGGIYAEVPYQKDRLVSSVYSLPRMREEFDDLQVELSNYHGGASIGSYLAKRAGEQDMELVSFYAFCPMFHLNTMDDLADLLRVRKDYKAWLDILNRVNFMIGLNLDLSDLEERSARMIEELDAKLTELDQSNPGRGIRQHFEELSDQFEAPSFSPLDDIWEEQLRKLGDEFFPDEE